MKILQWIKQKSDEVVVNITSLFCIIFFFIIYIISIGVTSDMTQTTDYAPYQVMDVPLLHLMLVPVVIVIFSKLKDKKISETIKKRLFIGITVFTVLLLGIYSGFFYADPAYALKSARGFIGNSRFDNFSIIYPAKYPYQSTYIIYLMPFCKIFGYFDFIFVTLVSVLMYAGSLYFIRKIFQIYFEEEYDDWMDLSLLLFLPGWFVSEFGYNDVPGLFFTICGCYLYLTRNESKKKFLLSILITGFGLAIRKNFLILLIAFFIVEFVKEKKWPPILFFIGSLMVYKGISFCSYEFLTYLKPDILKHERNYVTDRWIYIGLAESEAGAGYWAPDTAVNVDSSGLLKERITYLLTTPMETLTFFLKKFANTYAAADFDAIEAFRHKDTLFINREITKDFFYHRNAAYQIIYSVLNVFQPLIYIGNLFYLITNIINKKKDVRKYFGPIFFTGLFLFYIVWEIKARYVLFGILLILPTAIKGWEEIAKVKWKKTHFIIGFLVMIFILITATEAGAVIVNDEANQMKVNELSKRMDEMYEIDTGL